MTRRIIAPEYDLYGWKEIATALGLSERTCQRYASTPEDPMPVYTFGRNIRAKSAELMAWVERNTTHNTTGGDE